MLRNATDSARRMHPLHDAPNRDAPGHDDVTLRSFNESDFADLRRLYHEGVLSESVNPPDPAADAAFLQQRYFSRPCDHLWVAEAHGKVVASIGLTEDEKQIAHIRRLRVDQSWLEWHHGELVRMLIARAASHARTHDLLKLIIHTPLNDERAVAFLHQLGFEFARVRDRDGKHLLEFYVNIYDIPVATHSRIA